MRRHGNRTGFWDATLSTGANAGNSVSANATSAIQQI